MSHRDSGTDWVFVGGLALGIATLAIMVLIAASVFISASAGPP